VVADDHLEIRREVPDDLMHEFEEAGDGHAVFVQGDVLQSASLFGHVGGVVGLGRLVEHEEVGTSLLLATKYWWRARCVAMW
jgi:hypothetical protein